MGKVVGLDRREIDPLEASIRDSYFHHGQARAYAPDLTVTAKEWRALARRVARELGRPVQTLGQTDHLYAVLKDFPRDEREEAIHRAALRGAMRAAAGIGADTDNTA